MDTPFDLARFITAQDPVLPAVLAELRAGHKRTHWMWFVFPQLAGLGHSPTARFYALSGLPEATAYLHHPVLGPRLLQCTEAVAAQPPSRSVHAIFGTPDDLKFHSSMTLFSRVPGAPALFAETLSRHFAAQPDPATLKLLATP